MSRSGKFSRFATTVADATGHPLAFAVAFFVVVGWAATGPIFHFSDTWQLVINTSTTIITFLMVFLIQHTQNRDTRAMQIKLDEMIRCTEGAHVSLLDLEELSDRELRAIRDQYERLAEEARERLRAGGSDTDNPEVEAR